MPISEKPKLALIELRYFGIIPKLALLEFRYFGIIPKLTWLEFRYFGIILKLAWLEFRYSKKSLKTISVLRYIDIRISIFPTLDYFYFSILWFNCKGFFWGKTIQLMYYTNIKGNTLMAHPVNRTSFVMQHFFVH